MTHWTQYRQLLKDKYFIIDNIDNLSMSKLSILKKEFK